MVAGNVTGRSRCRFIYFWLLDGDWVEVEDERGGSFPASLGAMLGQGSFVSPCVRRHPEAVEVIDEGEMS